MLLGEINYIFYHLIIKSNLLLGLNYHVEVGKGSHRSPIHRSGLDGLDPEIVGEHKGEDSDTLIVVRSSHWSGDVAGHDCDEASSKETGAARPQLLGEEVGGDGGQATEEWGQEHANVADVGRNVLESDD